jgi:hypothetical protein
MLESDRLRHPLLGHESGLHCERFRVQGIHSFCWVKNKSFLDRSSRLH